MIPTRDKATRNCPEEKCIQIDKKKLVISGGLAALRRLHKQGLGGQIPETTIIAYSQVRFSEKSPQLVVPRDANPMFTRLTPFLVHQSPVLREPIEEFESRLAISKGGLSSQSHNNTHYFEVVEETEASSTELLQKLRSGDLSSKQLQELIYKIELCIFPDSERDALLDELLKYIQYHRKTDSKDQLRAVCSAIRKYIAILPMERMDELSEFLESGRSIHFQLELELEVAKMVYRNFEVHPPKKLNPCPELAVRLWDMTEQYTSSRVLLLEKFATIASLSILALVAMRSVYARRAWSIVQDCPYDWFKELMNDDMDNLRSNWRAKDQDAVDWLDTIRADPGAGI